MTTTPSIERSGPPLTPEVLLLDELQSAARTEQDPRHDNEDSFVQNDSLRLYAVCDGAGGREGGADASRIVSQGIERFFTDLTDELTPTNAVGFMKDAFMTAHHDMQDAVDKGGSPDMTTTATAVKLFAHEGSLYGVYGHVGDSRLVIQHPDGKAGSTTDECRGNRLINALYPSDEPQLIQFDVVELEPGCRILVCSDGITGDTDTQALTDDELRDILGQSDAGAVAERALELTDVRRNPDKKMDDKTVVVADIPLAKSALGEPEPPAGKRWSRPRPLQRAGMWFDQTRRWVNERIENIESPTLRRVARVGSTALLSAPVALVLVKQGPGAIEHLADLDMPSFDLPSFDYNLPDLSMPRIGGGGGGSERSERNDTARTDSDDSADEPSSTLPLDTEEEPAQTPTATTTPEQVEADTEWIEDLSPKERRDVENFFDLVSDMKRDGMSDEEINDRLDRYFTWAEQAAEDVRGEHPEGISDEEVSDIIEGRWDRYFNDFEVPSEDLSDQDIAELIDHQHPDADLTSEELNQIVDQLHERVGDNILEDVRTEEGLGDQMVTRAGWSEEASHEIEDLVQRAKQFGLELLDEEEEEAT